MTNPMPEAVTGDLIRWALTTLRTAGTSDAGVWTRELERVRLPSRGGAEVDVGRLSPSLRGFLRTLRGSSIAPELDPESIEPVLDRNVYEWDDAEEESPVEEPVRRVVVVVDCERSGIRNHRDQEFRDAWFRAVTEACSRVVGWQDCRVDRGDRGDGVMALLPSDADGESIARWFRLVAAGLSREHRPRYLAGVLGTRSSDRRVLWDLGRKLGLLRSVRDEFLHRNDPGPILVLPESVWEDLAGPDGRVMGIRRWQQVTPSGSTDRAWAAPWWPTPAGRPPDDALRRAARTARQLAGELTRARIGHKTRADPAWELDELGMAAKQLSADLANLARAVSEPGQRPLMQEIFRQASHAATKLTMMAAFGRRSHVGSAERQLYIVMVRLYEIVGDDDEAEPVHERPPGRPDQWRVHHRRPDLRLSAAVRSVHEGH
ncbi:hypothetical protein ACFV4G_09595 [Kitasatospora sp. NPDC059747]|uniref:hypothetical protein n=1 Tax=Kitasatospora sp. NPDC059747 TaxID=3346930 RepID=UPI00364F9928